MRIALLFAMALFATAPARAADLDDFLKRAVKLESQWQKPKPLCVCMDGSSLQPSIGTLEVQEILAGVRRARAVCRVPDFHASTRNFDGFADCLEWVVPGK